MLHFEEKEYELVEKILLGDGKFNSLQREFIEIFETQTIIAGPGAGKTTALAAKIVLLLRYLNRIGSKEGVCIITYTNVAVKEINTTLQKAGISSISHPHFIGTIHEFFNKFCVIPYFKKEYGHNSIFFNDEIDNELESYGWFLSLKNPWMNKAEYKTAKDTVANKTYESKLIFDNVHGTFDLVNTSGWHKFDKYKIDMLEAKLLRKKQGFLQYEDTFLFSQKFLNNPYYKEILKNRFKYLFIDEFQDTTPEGIGLLKNVFNSEDNVMQMIGDPYQTIMYEQPMPQYEEERVFTLNFTNRFGKEISQSLNKIIPQANIQTYDNNRSFNPVLLVYQDEKEIYKAYYSIIKEYEQQDVSFKVCEKIDKVLIWSRNWSSRIKDGVNYSDKKPRKFESKNVQLKRLVIEFICKKINNDTKNVNEFKKWIDGHRKIVELNNILLDFLKFGITDEGKNMLKNVINILLQEKGLSRINLSDLLFQKIEGLLNKTVEIEANEFESPDDIFTIHSVKGETLRSALVVNFDNGPLTNILFHRYGISDDDSYLYTDQNLLYVAMSRVVYLFVFAIHKDMCTAEVRGKLQNHWTIKEIQ